MRSILSLLKINFREALVLLLFLLVAGPAQANRIEGIVAVVDNTIIMESDLKEKMVELGAPEENISAQRQVLELMVENIVVKKIYKSLGFPPVSEKEAQEYAKKTGIKEEDAGYMIMKSTLMDVMVRSRVVVTEKMIQDYFNENQSYKGRESVHLKQILIKDNPTGAQKAFDDIKGGKDFEKVAKEVSDILLSGSSDIGWVAIEDLSDDVRKVVVNAKPGEVVGPIAMNGYNAIFEVVEKGVYGKKSLEEVYPEITEKLQTKYQQEAFRHWLEKMMSKYFIGTYI